MDRVKKGGKAKVNKPLAERRRRARINDALLQLKSIVLQSISNESTLMSKLEKADILEMTVEYIHKMQLLQGHNIVSGDSQLTTGTNVFVSDGSQYATGFNECTSRVADCISDVPDNSIVGDNVRTRLLEHLANVASTADFRNKSIQQNIDTDEREVGIGNESKISNVEMNENASQSEVFNMEQVENIPYTVLQSGLSNIERDVNVPYIMLQTGTSNVAYTMLQNGIFNVERDINADYTVLQSDVSNVGTDVNSTYALLPSEASNFGRNLKAVYTIPQSEVTNVERDVYVTNESLQSEVSNFESDTNTAYTMPPQSEVTNVEIDVNSAYTVLQSEVPNVQRDVNAAYSILQNEMSSAANTIPQNEVSSAQTDVNTTYTVLQSEVSNVERDVNVPNAVLQNEVPNVERDVNVPNAVLQNEVSNVETDVNPAYTVMQTQVFDAARDVNSIYALLQRRVSNVERDENTTHKMLQSGEVNVEGDAIVADTMWQYEVSLLERDENAAYTTFQNAEKPDINGEPTERGTSKIKDGEVVVVNDSKIINIPKKRKVLGDYTIKSRTENTRGLAGTAHISCIKPQVKSPKKSKKGSHGKDLRRVPKPIKKRITASVYKDVTKTCNHETENGNTDQVLSFTDNPDTSHTNIAERIDENQTPCMPNDNTMIYTNQPEGTYLNNLAYIDGQHLFGPGECRSSGIALQGDYYHRLAQHENNLPRMNTMQQTWNGSFPQKYALQAHSVNNCLPDMTEANSYSFYQHFFANNRHEDVWRPW